MENSRGVGVGPRPGAVWSVRGSVGSDDGRAHAVGGLSGGGEVVLGDDVGDAEASCGFEDPEVSVNTAGLSVDRLMTQVEMTTSTDASGSGMSSIRPLRNSTLGTRASAALRRARSSISSVRSSPYALPVVPTRRADSSTSMPPPEPRSSTMSPLRRSAIAVGLPQPSEAAIASPGSWSRSTAEYRVTAAGSAWSPSALPSQHAGPRRVTARAAAAYVWRTCSCRVDAGWTRVSRVKRAVGHCRRAVRPWRSPGAL